MGELIKNQDDLKQRYDAPVVRQLKPPPGPRRELLAVHSQVVKTLSQMPSNAACADCGQRSTWCCTTLCTFVCGRCAVLLTELPLGYETKPAHGPALAGRWRSSSRSTEPPRFGPVRVARGSERGEEGVVAERGTVGSAERQRVHATRRAVWRSS